MKDRKFEIIFLIISVMAGIAAIYSPSDYYPKNQSPKNLYPIPYPYPNPTIVVTNINNTGSGSLRQAIVDAANESTITFAPYLTGQTIHLASELVVNKSIIIDGSGLATPITISGDTDSDGDGDVQLISITSTASATINNINFAKGHAATSLKSGGINNLGSLTIHICTFSANVGDQGGAIRNSGKLIIDRCTFSSNSAPDGGAILNDNGATASITSSTFSQNTAGGPHGSGGAIGNIGNLIISTSEFSENTANLGGGAIINAINGTVTISDTSFHSNVASTDNGGAIYNTDSELTITATTFYLNTTLSKGGAIFNNSNNINISNSSFISNKANGEGGGAIFNNINGTANIENSIFSQNTADGIHGGGGAIINIGILGITASEFSSNTARIGGGAIVNLTNGTATISNTTIAENLSADGGAIINLEYTNLTLINSTLSHNSGGGLYIFGGSVNLKNSILANNTLHPDCYKSGGSVYTILNTLIENNPIGATSCGTPLLTGDPNLGPLANNGGSTQTMALLAGSSAIDAGNDAVCTAAPVSNASQNGVTRPRGVHCDIGAYEYPAPLPDLIITDVTISPVMPSPNQTFEIGITIKNQGGISGTNTVYRDVYIDRDPSTLIDPNTGCPPPGDFFRSDSFTVLSAGMTDTKTVTITGGLPKGNHQLWFYVDSRCLVIESGGGNNTP